MSFALITGASKGIGKSFAGLLASQNYNLLLVARSEKELQIVCNELQDRHAVSCEFLAMDLARTDAPEKIIAWIENGGYDVSILVNNAGFALWGPFHELSLQEQNEIIAVNIYALVNLTHLMIPKLMQQKKSYILNVASTTAYQAVPTLSIYSATKAFVLSFSRALHYELKESTVSVSCLSPGGTKTNFIERARMDHMQKASDKLSMEPEAVAAAGIKGMFAGKSEIIPGLMNRAGAFSTRLMPKWIVEKVAAGLYLKKKK